MDTTEVFVKLIAINDRHEKQIYYHKVNLQHNKFPFNKLERAIRRDLQYWREPVFFPQDFEIFWLDNDNDKVVINSDVDIKTYVDYLKRKKKVLVKFAKMYATSVGYKLQNNVKFERK